MRKWTFFHMKIMTVLFESWDTPKNYLPIIIIGISVSFSTSIFVSVFSVSIRIRSVRPAIDRLPTPIITYSERISKFLIAWDIPIVWDLRPNRIASVALSSLVGILFLRWRHTESHLKLTGSLDVNAVVSSKTQIRLDAYRFRSCFIVCWSRSRLGFG